MAGRIDTLLLLGLPACGKSVIRRYLSSVPHEVAASQFHIGPMVQLDDFPHVHFMWRISEAMAKLGLGRGFFDSAGEQFRDPYEFGTLVRLLNEDYSALSASSLAAEPPGEWIMNRLENARASTGMPAPFSGLDRRARKAVADEIDGEAAPFAAEWSGRVRPPGSTVVIEFARGGPEGSKLPLSAPYGYSYALSQLSEEILRSAVILYVLVTPEESRRRNRARAEPGAHGSALHHGVPERVLRESYGIDDMMWLMEHSEEPGTVTVPAPQANFHLRVACLDNRHHRSSLRRAPRPGEATELHESLCEAFAGLVG